MKVNKKATLLILALVLILSILSAIFANRVGDTSNTENHIEKTIEKDNTGVEYGLNKGNALPNFNLTNMKKDKVITAESLKGKKTILFFWASWCPYCKNTMTELDKVIKENKDVQVVAINATDVENNNEGYDYVKKNKHSFDSYVLKEEELKVFSINNFPTSIFIDSEGVIQEGVSGALTKEIINSQLKEMK